MGLVDKPYTFSNTPADTNVIDADQVNADLDALYTLLCGAPTGGTAGNVDEDNIGTLPAARVYNNANISIPDNTLTAVTFNSERYDQGTGTEQHSVGSQTSRLTCRAAGIYHIGACVEFAGASGGVRRALLRLNGATYIADADSGVGVAPYFWRLNPHADYKLAVGDYVELVVFQDSGGAVNVQANANLSPEFWWHWVSR